MCVAARSHRCVAHGKGSPDRNALVEIRLACGTRRKIPRRAPHTLHESSGQTLVSQIQGFFFVNLGNVPAWVGESPSAEKEHLPLDFRSCRKHENPADTINTACKMRRPDLTVG